MPAGAAVVVGGGWWVAIAELVPAADRPYIGGSTNNNVLQLAFGYNGLGRLTGSETGSIGGRAAAAAVAVAASAARPGSPGCSVRDGRPDHLAAAGRADLPGGHAVGTRRAARTDRTRAAALLWGGWLVSPAWCSAT